MTTQATADPLPAARLSTRLFFLSSGFVNAAWAPMVPFAKARTGLGTASFGAVLIGLGVGAVLIMPLVSWGLSRHGTRRCMAASCALLTLVLPLLAILSSPLGLAIALLCFGFGLGGLDAGMNAQAVEVEARSARPLMSGFHGMFSIGGLAGSLGLTLLLASGLSLLVAVFTIMAIFLVLWLTRLRGLLPGREPRPAAGQQSSLRLALHPVVLVIGALCFIGFLGEGATLDWSALFLHGKGLATAYGGVGYAAFSVTMAAGRLTGDALARRWGVVRLLRFSAILAALGWAAAVLVPGPAAVAGFALVGLGAANIVPLLFGAAARVPGVPTSVSIPLISALGYAGMLCGPAMVGFAAAATSLGVALSGVAALLLLVVAAADVALP
ncbi:MFS transporter [Acidisoma sp.]|uniref:MFS transporter n=1 Tax=Acidisoma sp. TaxID=1872115 RepID=UPI003AFF80B2